MLASLALALALPAGSPATLTEVGVIADDHAARPSPAAPPARAWPSAARPASRSRSAHPQPAGGARATARSSPGRSRSASRTPRRSSSSTPTRAASPKPGSRSCARSSKPNLTYKLIAQSPLVKLEPYFGKTAQFPLRNHDPGQEGRHRRADRAPWAPALALGFGKDTSWRASRPKSQCTSTSTQTHAHADRQRRCSTSACTRPRA